LEAQISEQGSFSSTPLDRLPTKPKPNPCEHCNYVTLKEKFKDFTDHEDIPIEEGRKIMMVESKEKNDGGKAAAFIENESVEIPTIFPPKLSDADNFSIPCIVGKMEIERALCDLGASLSLMPYSLFHKLYLGPLQSTPFSPQLGDDSKLNP